MADEQQWLRPDIGTLLIVGDTTIAQIKPMLEQRLGAWKAQATPVPKLPSTAVQKPTKPRVFLELRDESRISTTVMRASRWFVFELASDSDLNDALDWLRRAYEAA